jgi:ligand-binding sensor domain-containing protein
LQTDDGALWVATAGSGIGRYDGTAWQVFAPDAQLGTAAVHTLSITAGGTAWLGTPSGVARLDDHSCGFDQRLGARSNVLAADVDASGDLWFGTRSLGGMLWGARDASVWEAREWTGSTVSAVDAGPGGEVWFAGPEAVMRYAAGEWRRTGVDSDLAAEGIAAIALAPDRSVWIGTEHGAATLEGRRWRVFTTADGLGDNAVGFLLAAPDGSLWFATPGGLSRYRP